MTDFHNYDLPSLRSEFPPRPPFSSPRSRPTNPRPSERAVVRGLVTDSEVNLPVIGANVTLRPEAAEALLKGTTTDGEGRYRLVGIEPGRYILAVTFVGYQPRTVSLELAAGEERILDPVLQPGLELDPVTVTASRRPEKMADAPASVTVLGPREIESEVTVSPAEVLRTTTAVDIAQTGIDRREVVLRGFNNAFSGSAYVLTDYRKSSIPSLAANAFNLMPITNLDLAQIEVVRGPGSALYGPGVEEGVIHFRTKGPLRFPERASPSVEATKATLAASCGTRA